jgi:hypothetical protein
METLAGLSQLVHLVIETELSGRRSAELQSLRPFNSAVEQLRACQLVPARTLYAT